MALYTSRMHQEEADGLLQELLEELRDIEDNDAPEDVKKVLRYKAASGAFDQLIDESKAFKEIFRNIKNSYDNYIKRVDKENTDSVALCTKLKSIAAKPATLTNLKKRGDELEQQYKRMKEKNDDLELSLLGCEKDANDFLRGDSLYKEFGSHRSKPSNETKVCLEVPIEVRLEESLLRAKLASLDAEIKELEMNAKTKFIPKEEYDETWDAYHVKSQQRNLVQTEYQDLENEYRLLSVANRSARDFSTEEPLGKSIAEHVFSTLVDVFKTSIDSNTPITIREEDACAAVDHLEMFHSLLEEGRYDQAASLAGSSACGSVLRNKQTFKKLKTAQQANKRIKIMWPFAKAFMQGEAGAGRKNSCLDEEMTNEFIRSAVEAGEEKIVYQWFQNGLVQPSRQAADQLACNRHAKVHGTVVAEQMYMRMGLFHDAIRCMAFRGEIPAAISFAQETAHFKQEDYIDLLLSVPSLRLAQALSVQKYPNTETPLLPCGQIALLLVKDVNTSDIVGPYLKTLKADFDLDSQKNLCGNNIFSDESTSEQDWLHIVKHVEGTDFEAVGAEIIAALCVKNTLAKTSEEMSKE